MFKVKQNMDQHNSHKMYLFSHSLSSTNWRNIRFISERWWEISTYSRVIPFGCLELHVVATLLLCSKMCVQVQKESIQSDHRELINHSKLADLLSIQKLLFVRLDWLTLFINCVYIHRVYNNKGAIDYFVVISPHLTLQSETLIRFWQMFVLKSNPNY